MIEKNTTFCLVYTNKGNDTMSIHGQTILLNYFSAAIVIFFPSNPEYKGRPA